jgi:hypothetical protein
MKDTIRQFYRRLNHRAYGVTELVVIDPSGKEGVIATGFFDSEDEFVKACQQYNGRYNIYAGRNPRPRWFPKTVENSLDRRYRQRASDSDIDAVTAISIDIDPIRPKGTSSTDEQHRVAIGFALNMSNDISGWVDDSGNGAYLWIPFKSPIMVPKKEMKGEIKEKCRLWQANIIRRYQPQRYGLRIDGCYDLSRLKKVIGTVSVKGSVHRTSRFVKIGTADDRIRDEILALQVQTNSEECLHSIKPSGSIPERFLRLLRTSSTINEIWTTPNGDRSSHDWLLGCELAREGLKAEEIASVLMINPFGKYQRDRRFDYIQSTMRNIMSNIQSD